MLSQKRPHSILFSCEVLIFFDELSKAQCKKIPYASRERFSYTELLLGALEPPPISGKAVNGIKHRVLQHLQCYFHHQRSREIF